MAEKSRFKAIKCLSSHINFCLFFCQYDQEHSISLQGVFLKIFVEYKQLDFCSAYFVPGTAPYLRTHVVGVCVLCVRADNSHFCWVQTKSRGKFNHFKTCNGFISLHWVDLNMAPVGDCVTNMR